MGNYMDWLKKRTGRSAKAEEANEAAQTPPARDEVAVEVPDSEQFIRSSTLPADVKQRLLLSLCLGSRVTTCARCGSTLELLDMNRGGVNLGAPSPFLFNGVVCKCCQKVECTKCHGMPPDKPCTWCRGAVDPAFDKALPKKSK